MKFKKKLIVSNMIVIIGVFLFFIVTQNYRSFEEYKDVRVGDYNRILNQFREGMDHLLSYEIEEIPSMILSNKDISKSVYDENYEWSSVKIYRMKDIYTNFLTKSRFIKGLDIYYNEDEIAFLSGSYKKIEDYTSKPYIDWIYNVRDFNKDKNWIATRYYEPMEEELVSCIVDIPFLPSNRVGKIAIHLDMYELEKYTNNLLTEDIGSISIIDAIGQPVSGVRKSKESTELVLNSLNREENFVIYENKSGENTISFMKRSQVNDWVYLYTLPLKEVYNFQTFSLRNGIMGIGFIAVTAIITTLMNLILYGPIKEIFSLVDSLPMDDVEEEAVAEADIIAGKLKSMVTNYTQLETHVKKNKHIISSYHLKGFLRGKYSYHDILETGTINSEYTTGFCVTLKLREQGTPEQMRQMLAVIREGLNKEFHGYICYTAIDSDVLYALFCVIDTYVDPLKIVKKTMLELNIEDMIYAGIGKSVSLKKESIVDSFKASKEAVRYAFVLPELTYFDCNEEDYSSYKTTGSRDFIISNLEKSILLCDYDACEQEITRIFQALHYGKYHIHYCTNTCYELCSTIRRACDQLGYSLDQHLQYDLRDSIYSIENIYDLEIKLKNIVYNSLKTVSSEKKTNEDAGNDLRIRIEKIVHSNLFNDISLQFIADSVEMRYDTLSRNFQSIMGCTYSKYIKKIKLNKSVELLAQHKYTVKDIASMLGYNSTHYFIQVFKKHYGMTPKKYQETELMNEENN